MRGIVQEQLKNAEIDGLVIVSNRAPYVLESDPANGIGGVRAVSGLVSSLEPVVKACGGKWVGWCGRASGRSGLGEEVRVPFEQPSYTVQEVLLSEEDYRLYYHGFSNDCLWPLYHCFLEKTSYDHDCWESYVRVNRLFAEAALRSARDTDLIWVHDYHLSLVPRMLRDMGYRGRIAYFCHIPFPPVEIFCTLPWARDILEGMLGSDLVAFHLPAYVDNFLRSVKNILRLSVGVGDIIVIPGSGHKVYVKALPIGIDSREFAALARDPAVKKHAEEIRGAVGCEFLFLSVERLDYTKGVLEKLKGIEVFFEKYPDYRNRVAFLQVAVPTRSGVQAYASLRGQVEEAVGRINGLYGSFEWVPVRYFFRSLNRRELVAHYLAADAALVTPLRDGLNLVAKEYVASRVDGSGVLVLSPFAGAAEHMKGCLFANPYDPVNMAEQMRAAVEMPESERRRRMLFMQQIVSLYDVNWWWQKMLASLTPPKVRKVEISVKDSGKVAGDLISKKAMRGG